MSQDSFEAPRSDEAKQGQGRIRGQEPSNVSSRSGRKPSQKAAGGSHSDEVDSDEVSAKLLGDADIADRHAAADNAYIEGAPRVLQLQDDEGAFTQRPSDEGSGSFVDQPPPVEEEEDNSDLPPLSEERGPVKKDIAKIFATIEDYAKSQKDIAHEFDKQLRAEVLGMSEERLQKAATYMNCKNKQTPLHYAAKEKDHEILRLLLANGAEIFVDSLDAFGFTPLTWAVDFCDKEGIAILLEYSQRREDALCYAIELYEITHSDDQLEPQKVLKWLIGLPVIQGLRNGGPTGRERGCFNNNCQPLPDSKLSLTALQCLALYRDKVLFEELLEILRRLGLHADFKKRVDADGNSLVQLAIKDADPDDDQQLECIHYLVNLYSFSVNELNLSNQTALNMACEAKAYPIIDLLAANNAKLIPDLKDSNHRESYLSPLHQAVRGSDLQLFRYLLEKFPAEAQAIFQNMESKAEVPDRGSNKGKEEDTNKNKSQDVKRDVLAELFNDSLEAWRAKILANEDDTVQKEILKELLQHDTTDRVLLSLFEETERKINSPIIDEGIRKSMMNLCSKLHSDYCLVSRHADSNAQEQKLKALCSVSTIKKVADSYLQKKQPTVVQKEDTRQHFLLCIRHLLYSNKIKTLAGIAICALFGMAVGAVVGFIIGQVVTAGAGGGFVLGPPTAEYGCAVGAIIGCIIFGAGFGASRYLLSDLFKSHMSLWAISKAMLNNLTSQDSPLSKKEGSSPRDGKSIASELRQDEPENSFEPQGRGESLDIY